MATLHTSPAPAEFSTKEELEDLLLEGLDSGTPMEVTPEFWADLSSQLAARRLEKRKAS